MSECTCPFCQILDAGVTETIEDVTAPVRVRTAERTAVITWTETSDPRGFVASAMQEKLGAALAALGDDIHGGIRDLTPEQALRAAQQTSRLVTTLRLRVAAQIVSLRDDHGLSWRQIAAALYGDPDRSQSHVRSQYDYGRRMLGKVI